MGHVDYETKAGNRQQQNYRKFYKDNPTKSRRSVLPKMQTNMLSYENNFWSILNNGFSGFQ